MTDGDKFAAATLANAEARFVVEQARIAGRNFDFHIELMKAYRRILTELAGTAPPQTPKVPSA